MELLLDMETSSDFIGSKLDLLKIDYTFLNYKLIWTEINRNDTSTKYLVLAV